MLPLAHRNTGAGFAASTEITTVAGESLPNKSCESFSNPRTGADVQIKRDFFVNLCAWVHGSGTNSAPHRRGAGFECEDGRRPWVGWSNIKASTGRPDAHDRA